MLRIAMAAFVCAALTPIGAAAEQARQTPACKDGEMPFAATAANRLAGAALQQAVTNKKLVYIRESVRTPGSWFKGTREHRDDGSQVYTCHFGGAPGGPWRPCTTFGSVERRAQGGRDVGVWSVKGDALCSTKSAFEGRVEDCFAIHRQGAVYAARRVSGPLSACVQGAITFE